MTDTKIAYEDFEVGGTIEFGPRAVPAEEMIDFATLYDPQPMHLDQAAGEASLLGGLAASGLFTASIFMRMMCDGYLLNSTSQGSPGLDYVNFRRPLMAGARPHDGSVQARIGLPARAGLRLRQARAVQPERRAGLRDGQYRHVLDARRRSDGMTLDAALAIGETVTLGRHTFEADEIKAFASKYDPQRFHVDEEAAKASVFGRLCASGWHTAAMWMKHNVASFPATAERARPRGATLTFGPAAGLRDLKWLKPVYVGDTITFTRTADSHRALVSKPGWRLLSSRCEAHNQNGEPVMRFVSLTLVKAE
jgi:acyl dehydratase